MNDHEIRAAVDTLVSMSAEQTVKIIEQIADVFDSEPLQHEFMTGAMVASIIRDALGPLQEASRRD